MNKVLFIIIFLSQFSQPVFANTLDSLVTELDVTMQNRKKYDLEKEKKIVNFKKILFVEKNDLKKYSLMNDIIKEYILN